MANDGSLTPEQEEEEHHITSYTVLAIDQFVVPTSWCPNGHILEWRNEETGIVVCMLRRVNTDIKTTEAVCIVCGRAAEQEPEDAPSEGDAGN